MGNSELIGRLWTTLENTRIPWIFSEFRKIILKLTIFPVSRSSSSSRWWTAGGGAASWWWSSLWLLKLLGFPELLGFRWLLGLLEFTRISGIIGMVGIMFNYVGCSVGTRLKFSNSAIMNYWCSILGQNSDNVENWTITIGQTMTTMTELGLSTGLELFNPRINQLCRWFEPTLKGRLYNPDLTILLWIESRSLRPSASLWSPESGDQGTSEYMQKRHREEGYLYEYNVKMLHVG